MSDQAKTGVSGCRLVFCTYPSLYSSVVLDILAACPQIEIVGIVESTRFKRKGVGHLRSVIEILRQAGLSYALYLLVASTLWRLLGSRPLPTVSAFARRHGIPLHRSADINNASSLAFLQACRPDVLLCAHFNQRLGEQPLKLPVRHAINIHPSALPAYRGFDPVFFAMARREAAMGVSLHLMDTEFDQGDLLAVSELPVEPQASLMANNLKLFTEGARLAVGFLSAADGQLASRQQACEGEYLGWPTRAEVKGFRRSGCRLWSLSDLKQPVS